MASLRDSTILRKSQKTQIHTSTASAQHEVEAAAHDANPTTPPPGSVRVLCAGIPCLFHAESRTVFPDFSNV